MRFRVGLFVLAGCLVAGNARAEGFITPFVGYSFGGESSAYCASLSNCQERRTNWGVSVGATHGIFGVEEDIAYSPDFFGKTTGGDNAVLTVMSNVLVVLPAGPIRPYGLVGIGLIRPHAQLDPSSLTTDKNALGYDIGGGVNVSVAPHVAVRGELRHLHTFSDVTLSLFSGQALDFWRASAGLTLRF